MNRRLKEHLTIEGQAAADALQVDLLKLVRQEGIAAVVNSAANELTQLG